MQKLFAFRSRDVADVESIAARMGDRLEWNYIEASLTPLAEIKDDPGILPTLQRLRDRYGA